MTIVVILVLARILGPATYGTIAIAAPYVLLIQTLIQQALVPAIVQRPELGDEDIDAGFWLAVVIGLGLGLAGVALGVGLELVTDLEQVGVVVAVLALVGPIRSLGVVQDALLRRSLDFKSLAVRTNVAVLVSGLVAVALAAAGAGVWAFVGQQLTLAIVEIALLWHLHPYRPGSPVLNAATRQLFSFSTGSSLGVVGQFFSNRADPLILGPFFAAPVLGVYYLANRMVNLLIDLVIRPIQTVALPELSRHQHDRDAFAGRTLDMVKLTALLALPALGILAGVSEPLARVVGADWDQLAVPAAVLTIAGAGRAMGLLGGPILQALGQPYRLAALTWLVAGASIVLLGTTGYLVEGSPPGEQLATISWTRALLWALFILPANTIIVMRAASVSITSAVRAVVLKVLAGLVGAATGIAVSSIDVIADLPSVVSLSVVGVCTLVVTLGALVADRDARTLLRLKRFPSSYDAGTGGGDTVGTRGGLGSSRG